jgi:nucleotide-binding universal stress UspA family protein
MYPLRTVLCASDLSDAAGEPIEQAAAMAREDGARLVVLHVVPVPIVVPEAVGEVVPPLVNPEVVYAREKEALDRQVAQHPAAASAIRELIQASGSTVDEILGRAQALEAGVVVVASHRRSSVERVLLGSTALSLVRRARCPVLVARKPGQRGKVVVATDLSLTSLPALRAAAEEARRRQARLIVVHALDLPPAELALGNAVVPAPPDDPRSRSALRRAAEQRLASFLRKAEVESDPIVAEGAPAASIVALAEQAAVELVVVGTTSGRRLEHALLGSVAEAVVRRAPCSVLTVPALRAAAAPSLDLLDE